jgi:hypothetical protein
VAGFIQPVVFEGDERKGYDLLLLPTQENLPLVRWTEEGMRFEQNSFERAAALWNEADNEHHPVQIADEMGRVEAMGGGHWPAVMEAMRKRKGVWVLSLRRDCLVRFTFRLGQDIDLLELPAKEPERLQWIDRVAQARAEAAS